MALKSIRYIINFTIALVLLAAFIPSPVLAKNAQPYTAPLPSLNTFIERVKNGEAAQLRGVYVPEILAARVVQQPADKPEFVSPFPNMVTQFNPAKKLGSTGLLAHNYMAGANFSLLKKGGQFYLVYGDGLTVTFTITEILRYQALTPTSPASDFVDLKSGAKLSASKLFSKAYNHPGYVIFQTCIAANGNPSWGRIFVIAKPYVE